MKLSCEYYDVGFFIMVEHRKGKKKLLCEVTDSQEGMAMINWLCRIPKVIQWMMTYANDNELAMNANYLPH